MKKDWFQKGNDLFFVEELEGALLLYSIVSFSLIEFYTAETTIHRSRGVQKPGNILVYLLLKRSYTLPSRVSFPEGRRRGAAGGLI